jgi:hypothetical protein
LIAGKKLRAIPISPRANPKRTRYRVDSEDLETYKRELKTGGNQPLATQQSVRLVRLTLPTYRKTYAEE